jgi:hypothetical protein
MKSPHGVRENDGHLEGIWNFWDPPDPRRPPIDAGQFPEKCSAVARDLTFDRSHGSAAWPTTQTAEAKILKSKTAPSISICRGHVETYAVPLGKSRARRLFRSYSAAGKAPQAANRRHEPLRLAAPPTASRAIRSTS